MKKKKNKEEKRIEARLKWLMENGFTYEQAMRIINA